MPRNGPGVARTGDGRLGGVSTDRCAHQQPARRAAQRMRHPSDRAHSRTRPVDGLASAAAGILRLLPVSANISLSGGTKRSALPSTGNSSRAGRQFPPVMQSRISPDISVRHSGPFRLHRTVIGSAAVPSPNLQTVWRANVVPCRPRPRMRGMLIAPCRALAEHRPYRRKFSPVGRFPHRRRRAGRNSATRLRSITGAAQNPLPENAAGIVPTRFRGSCSVRIGRHPNP